MSSTFFEPESKLQNEFWAVSNVLMFILESCFSALQFGFVFVKHSEFLHILKEAWTLLKMPAWENPLSSVGVGEADRVSLHGMGHGRRPK